MTKDVNFDKFVKKVEFNKLQKQVDKLQSQLNKFIDKGTSNKTRKKKNDSF